MKTISNDAISAGRILKLRRWIESDFEGNVAAFCRQFNLPVSSASYISQLFSSGRNFGEKAARKFEQQAGLPPGWFDADVTINMPVKVSPPLFNFDRDMAAKLPIEQRELITEFIAFLIMRNEQKK